MSYAGKPCDLCGELIKFNNMNRHMKRRHSVSYGKGEDDDQLSTAVQHRTPRSDRSEEDRSKYSSHQSRRTSDDSTGSVPTDLSTVSADYVRDAVLCMLRRVDAVNIPSLSTYLKAHFPDIPQPWQMPIIVATYTAVQKAAATHGDAMLDGDDERT